MATSPLSNIYTPSEEEYSKMMVATADISSAGGTSVATITLDNAYPAIDQTIPSPVLAIVLMQDGATLAANGIENFLITGQCDGTPDSAGEFQITGDRTIDVYQTAAESQAVLVFYIARGTGEKR
jgi:hypothetical protein